MGNLAICSVLKMNLSDLKTFLKLMTLWIQGEELRKQIGAAAYIECSSKTQQVSSLIQEVMFW